MRRFRFPPMWLTQAAFFFFFKKIGVRNTLVTTRRGFELVYANAWELFERCFRCEPGFSYLTQFSGSRSQAILHMNLSQCNQPMVGVSANPLSRATAAGPNKNHTRININRYIFTLKHIIWDNDALDSVVWAYFLFPWVRPLSDWRRCRPMGSKCVCDWPMSFSFFFKFKLFKPGSANFNWQSRSQNGFFIFFIGIFIQAMMQIQCRSLALN